MWWQKESFLLKINPKYLQVSFGMREEPPIGDKLRGGGLKILYDLEN